MSNNATLPIGKNFGSFMLVEPVLRYLRKNALALPQYKQEDYSHHFFKCEDIEEKIGKSLFRIMECEVTQHLFNIK